MPGKNSRFHPTRITAYVTRRQKGAGLDASRLAAILLCGDLTVRRFSALRLDERSLRASCWPRHPDGTAARSNRPKDRGLSYAAFDAGL